MQHKRIHWSIGFPKRRNRPFLFPTKPLHFCKDSQFSFSKKRLKSGSFITLLTFCWLVSVEDCTVTRKEGMMNDFAPRAARNRKLVLEKKLDRRWFSGG